jgi:hypothetical protein
VTAILSGMHTLLSRILADTGDAPPRGLDI